MPEKKQIRVNISPSFCDDVVDHISLDERVVMTLQAAGVPMKGPYVMNGVKKGKLTSFRNPVDGNFVYTWTDV